MLSYRRRKRNIALLSTKGQKRECVRKGTSSVLSVPAVIPIIVVLLFEQSILSVRIVHQYNTDSPADSLELTSMSNVDDRRCITKIEKYILIQMRGNVSDIN